MASINFNPFEGWFRKPPNPLPPINLLSLADSFFPKTPTTTQFASLSLSNPFKGPKKPDPKPESEPEKPGYYAQLLEHFFWECENLPDYRHTPEVDKILNDDPIWEKKENPTEEELKENEKFWKEFRASPVVQFLARAEQIADKINEMELKENEKPYRIRLGAAATAFIHKLQKEEAVESKRRDLAVLEANDGVWPGVRTPCHALFLWASGSELTTILEQDHMPNKCIPKDLRLELSRIIPGLRPWEVVSVEQAMDQITYEGEWYREPLGTYTTGPPYLRAWNMDVHVQNRHCELTLLP